MKTISWKIAITEDNRLATMEQATGFPNDKIETHLVIIGILENLKEHHQAKMRTMFNKSISQNKGISVIDSSDSKEVEEEVEVEEEEEDEE